MAPQGGQKRKRAERTYSQDGTTEGTGRPSPHRPQNLHLAQQSQQHGAPGGRVNTRSSNRGSVASQASPVAGSPVLTKASPTAAAGSQASPMNPVASRDQIKAGNTVQPERKSSAAASTQAASARTPVTYYYNYLTDDRIQSWKSTGKSELLEELRKLSSDARILEFSNVFQELVKAGLDGRLDPEQAGSTIKDIISLGSASDGQDPISIFLDTLSIVTEYESANPRLRELISYTAIPPQRLRDELDVPLLVSLGLLRDTFSRMGVRKATNLLYRQSNYNLLREESEGYAKLLTDYFSIIYLSGQTEPAYIEEAVTKVKALIGAFDLDVGRVLDVTLDVFANSLVQGRRFIPIFLRMSPWWPEKKQVEGYQVDFEEFAGVPYWVDSGSLRGLNEDEKKEKFALLKDERDRKFWTRVSESGILAWFELGGRRIIREQNSTASPEDAPADTTDRSLDWATVTGTAPPPGNRTAAQILGFKLRSYNKRWTARDPANKLPENIPHLAALLIKIGFISLRDLYPHLLPTEEEMTPRLEKLKRKIVEEELKSRAGNMSSLAMAKPLSDDDPPRPPRFRESTPRPDAVAEKNGTPSKDAEKAIDDGEEPVDQKAALAKSLLLVGAIPDALYILGKHPMLMDAYPEMPKYIHRIIHHSIQNVYDQITAASERTTLGSPKQQVVEQSKSGLQCATPPSVRSIKWLEMDREAVGGVIHQYFWEDWTDTVPVCQTVDDFFLLCNSFMNLSGVRIGQDPILLSKLVRIGQHSITQDSTDGNMNRWVDLCKRLVVPALSLSKLNVGLNEEVWGLLSLFPVRTRFSIYSEWFRGPTSRLPEMRTAFDRARYETNQILKRLSKDNVKETAGKLTKVTGTSPGIVFEVALNQLESYPNFIDVVVQCAKHFSSITYDLLFWALVLFLGGRGKVQVQDDGMITSVWLQNLAKFTGSILGAYYKIDSTPILQYLEFGIRKGDFVKLQVLEKVIEIVGGIQSDVELDEQRTYAMAGGELLKAQTLQLLKDERHLRKAQSHALMANLSHAQLAGKLLIGIAQCQQTYIFSEDNMQEDGSGTKYEAPTKVLAMNLDKIRDVLMQFLEFLRCNLTPQEFEASIPGLISLISEYGLEPSLAFTISRPSINHAMSEYNARAALETPGKPEHRRTASLQQASESDTEMADASGSTEINGQLMNGNESTSATESETTKSFSDKAKTSTGFAPLSDSAVVSQEHIHPVLSDLVDRIRPLLPSNFEMSLSVSFFVRFWQLSLPDMLVATSAYADENRRLQTQISRIGTDRKNISAADVRERERRRKQVMELQDRLQAEAKAQLIKFQYVRRELKPEKDTWFSSFPRSKHEAVNSAILQYCFLPRIVQSSADALYTYKMLIFLHASGTPGFFTMHLLDEFFREKQLTLIIYQCTTYEAKNLGRFLQELLKELSSWHSSSNMYERTALGIKDKLPGFARKFGPDGLPQEWLVYEQYRSLLFKWHRNLSNAFKSSFSSPEFMHIQNALTLLNVIKDQFPVVNFMGTQLRTVIDEVLQNETRSDLRLSLGMLGNSLKAKEKTWVLPQAFHMNAGAAKQDAANRVNTPGTSQPGGDAKTSLNAAANEFQPRPATTVNGRRNMSTSGPSGTEDGEIEDGRDSRKPSISSEIVGERVTEANAAAKLLETSGTSTVGSQGSEREMPSNPQDSSRPTPPPAPNGLTRPNHDRGSNQTISGRTTHALPTRPDMLSAPPQRGRGMDRRDPQPDRPGARSSRDFAQQDYGRLDRPLDIPRNGPPVRSVSPGRHGSGRSRSPMRAPAGERDVRRETRERYEERPMRAGPQDPNRPDTRNPRWQSQEDGRQRSGSSSNMGPPLSGHSQMNERPGALNPERAALIQGHQSDRSPNHYPSHGDRQMPPAHDRGGLNPERGGYMESRSREEMRPDRDVRERPSRPQSPRRYDDRPRDDRRDDHAASERVQGHRRDDSFNSAPTGPRGRQDVSASSSSRDLFQAGPQRPPPVDPNYGRLSQDFGSRSGESTYGRLNAPDAPSGPRGGASGRGGRNFTGPAPLNTQRPVESPQHHMNTSPNTDRLPPFGPAGDRRERRDPGLLDSSRSGPNSAPHTPASEQAVPELSGVHPSRLAGLQTNGPPPPPSRHPVSGGASGPPSVAPSGPRAGRPHSHGMPPSPNTRGPPLGPAAAGERPMSNDRRFANIQNTLQSSTPATTMPNDRGSGASIRGRASNTRLGADPNIPSSSNMQPHSAVPPHMQQMRPADSMPQRQDPQMRSSDLMHGRGMALGGGGGSADYENLDDHSHSEGRSGRPTRDSSHRESRNQRHRSGSRSPRGREARDASGGKRERDEGKFLGEEQLGGQQQRERRSHRGDPEGREGGSRRSARGDDAAGSARERSEREPRERRELRSRDEHHRASGQRLEEMMPPQNRRGPPLMQQQEMEHGWGMQDGRGGPPPPPNGEGRLRSGGGERRDERERRDTRDMGPRKRTRGMDEGGLGEQKRPRRSQ